MKYNRIRKNFQWTGMDRNIWAKRERKESWARLQGEKCLPYEYDNSFANLEFAPWLKKFGYIALSSSYYD